jgi:hypothetical protein
MKKDGLLNRISHEARKMAWKMNCQAIGTGFENVKYLAPCVFKVAISNTRIVKVEDRIVSLPVFYALLKNNIRNASNNGTEPNFELYETKFATNCLRISSEKSHRTIRLSSHYPIHKI